MVGRPGQLLAGPSIQKPAEASNGRGNGFVPRTRIPQAPADPEAFEKEFEQKQFTEGGDRNVVKQMFARLYWRWAEVLSRGEGTAFDIWEKRLT